MDNNNITPARTCPKCGRVLDAEDMFCPGCGENLAAPVPVKLDIPANASIEEFNRRITAGKKKKKRFLFIWLPIILVVLIGAGVLSWFLYFEPNSRYTEALALYDDGKYEEAIGMFTELDGFKDSEEQITRCETAIKQEKYDKAIALYEQDKNYGAAITALEALDGFSDSAAKIEEIREAYLSFAQIAYALISRGYDLDQTLGQSVYNTLALSYLRDGLDSLAMTHLYSGTSYSVFYYDSWYSYGYKYIVESDMAQSFVDLLEASDGNMGLIELSMLTLENPPAEFQSLYSSIQSLYSTYSSYHSFIQTKPSSGYSSYDAAKDSMEAKVDSAISKTKKQDSKITAQVAEYAWD
ncbi:MAG: zinc-ribbon domain-containing protein [Ruminococcaceae bacterium]|nr:zinc-ribbon domain-containing protein [Oscillospiraceae bacterium]